MFGTAPHLVNLTILLTLAFRTVRQKEATHMTSTNAIEHCQRHIERTRAEIQRREALGHDAERHRKHLKTLEALLALHKAARNAA